MRRIVADTMLSYSTEVLEHNPATQYIPNPSLSNSITSEFTREV